MERNPTFWGPAPTVDRVDYRVYTNQEAMIQALKNGEIDIADGLHALAHQLGLEHPEHHGPEGGLGLVAEPRVQLRWPEPRRAPAAGAARHHRAQGHRDGDRQERDRQQGLRGRRDHRRYDRAPGIRVLAPGHPRRSGASLRPGGRQHDAGRRRLPRHERRRGAGGPCHRRDRSSCRCPPPRTPPARSRRAS